MPAIFRPGPVNPHRDDERHKVYDDQKTSDADLREITGISPEEERQMEQGAYDDKFNSIKDQEEQGDEGSDEGGKKSDSSDDLRNKEEGKKGGSRIADAAGDFAKGGALGVVRGWAGEHYDDLQKDKKIRRNVEGVKGIWRGSKKKGATVTIGGIVAGVLAIVFGAIINILPLKSLHFTDNLQDIYFASVDQATQKMVEGFLHEYYVNHVIPGMLGRKGCTTTLVDKSCSKVGDAKTGPGALYRVWHQENIEGKIAKHPDLGFEIRRSGNKFWVHSPKLAKDIDLGNYNPNSSKEMGDKLFVAMNRQELRQFKKNALEDILAHKRIMYWWSVGKWLDYKYKVRRCVMVCTYVDTFDDWKDTQVHTFKLFLVSRVLIPRSEVMGLVLECALSDWNCVDPGQADENGEKQSKFETDMRAALATYQAKYGDEGLKKLQEDADTVKKNGFMYYSLERIVGKGAAMAVSKAFPIVGWIDFAARLYSGATKVGPAMVKINFLWNMAAYISTYQVLRTTADEQKTGHLSPAQAGGMAMAFDRKPGGDLGGGGAQDSPSYNAIMHYGNPDPAISFDWSAGKVYAEKSIAGCEDGPYPAGKIICPAVSNDKDSNARNVAKHISATANAPALVLPKYAAIIWVHTGGAIWDFVSFITIGQLSKLAVSLANAASPEQLQQYLLDTVEWFKKIAGKYTLVNPYSDDPDKQPGSRTWEIAVCGGDGAGNEAAHWVQGGQVLTPSQLSAIRARQYAERREEFEHKSLYARMFDKNDSMSLISRVADATPVSGGDTGALVTGVASGLMRTASTSLASTILPTKAFAAQRQTPDPCGVIQYGWPDDSRVFNPNTNKDDLWKEMNCDDPNQVRAWGESAKAVNPNTYMLEHTKGNECLLMKSAISSGGGRFDSSLLQTFTTEQAGAPVGGGDGAWHWPPNGHFHAGPCWDTFVQGHGYHAGMDMNMDQSGTIALAAHDGEVVKVDTTFVNAQQDPEGRYVIVKATGSETVYYAYEHMESIKVKEGDTVVGGKTEIGVIGKTGAAPQGGQGHLHMVVAPTATLGSYSSSHQRGTLDPMKFLTSKAPYGYQCTK